MENKFKLNYQIEFFDTVINLINQLIVEQSYEYFHKKFNFNSELIADVLTKYNLILTITKSISYKLFDESIEAYYIEKIKQGQTRQIKSQETYYYEYIIYFLEISTTKTSNHINKQDELIDYIKEYPRYFLEKLKSWKESYIDELKILSDKEGQN